MIEHLKQADATQRQKRRLTPILELSLTISCTRCDLPSYASVSQQLSFASSDHAH